MRLYDLIPAYKGIMYELEQAETSEQIQMLLDTLECVDASLEVKTDGYCKMITMLERYADAKQSEADRHQDGARQAVNKANRLRERLMIGMELMDKQEIRSDIFTVQIRQNPVSVDVHDPDAIPDEFKKTKTQITVSPDRIAIKKAIEAGQEVPGASLMRTRKLVLK